MYDNFYSEFKASMYDANQWATLFKDAGAQYVYMTAKHSDGFALWSVTTLSPVHPLG